MNHDYPRMQGTGRPWRAALVLALCVLPGIGAAQQGAALTVTAALPHEVAWPDLVQASGAVEAWQEAVVSAQVGGQRLVEILAEVGDQVDAGQVLARFDAATLRVEQAELQAALAQAQAALREAEANRERALALKARGTLSEQDILRQLTQADIARAQLAAAQARLAAKHLELDYTQVTAPDAGLVSARRATLGAVAQPGQELFRIIRQGRLEWRGELTAQQLGRVAAGQTVELGLPDGSRAQARVRQLSPALDAGTRLALVYADLQAGTTARAGMYVQGTILLQQRPALAVPAGSVVIRDGRSYVFRLDGDGDTARVSAQPVTVGRRMADQIEIVTGLTAGERVVAEGAGFLNDGDTVRIARGERQIASDARP